MKKYYAMEVSQKEADIFIFGDITSWEWLESDRSSYTLSKEISALDADVEQINVYINSYGGEVAEGLAIYNMLKRHKARIRTICDGFACSIASVIFMAGDERVMNNSSLLMIHNAWMWAAGNADQLRKAADDLETINTAVVNAYLGGVNIDEAELKALLDGETWLLPDDALDKGFATSIKSETKAETKAAASVRKNICQMLTAKQVIPEPKPPDEPAIPDPEPAPPEQNKVLKLFAGLKATKGEN